MVKLGVLACAFNPSTQETEIGVCIELDAKLVYATSSRTAEVSPTNINQINKKDRMNSEAFY